MFYLFSWLQKFTKVSKVIFNSVINQRLVYEWLKCSNYTIVFPQTEIINDEDMSCAEKITYATTELHVSSQEI